MNVHGYPATLEPRHPGNANAAAHGVYSARLREPRAQEIADAIMAEPHTAAIDWIGAGEIGRLEALIEALDAAIAAKGIVRSDKVRSLVDLRLRASRRLAEWLDRYGMTPKGRAEWARQLAEGGLAAEIARRRAEVNRELGE